VAAGTRPTGTLAFAFGVWETTDEFVGRAVLAKAENALVEGGRSPGWLREHVAGRVRTGADAERVRPRTGWVPCGTVDDRSMREELTVWLRPLDGAVMATQDPGPPAPEPTVPRFLTDEELRRRTGG
jgi:hypothetical protein